LLICVGFGATTVAAQAPEQAIGAPGMPLTVVDPSGDLHEDWGVIGLRLVEPSGTGARGQDFAPFPVPTVTTTVTAGSISLAAIAYRAPIWPDGVDVLIARLENNGAAETRARLQVALPEQVFVGERLALLGGRAVLALPKEPQPVRRERSWGCLGGDVPMPGWGRPEIECDPAFRNIRAGMGGVPIIYRFSVPAGAKRAVVLGFCESHHVEAGQRPLLVYVEGAPRAEVDPIAAWGRHRPGCLRFDARDANEDGRLQIAVAPHPQAPDRNTILNAIWVFSSDIYVDTDEVLRGELSASAEHYVDVGGTKDQSLYEGGTLTYDLPLAPGAKQELMFLVACPGASVPNPESMAWTQESLHRAAREVWRDWVARKARQSRASQRR
jgi:hypothetical protein